MSNVETVAFEDNCVQIQKDPHYQQQECSLETLVSGNVRLVLIFAEIMERRHQTTVCGRQGC